MTRQTDEVKHKLDETETQLRDAKTKAGIISPLEDSKKTIADMTSKIQQEIYEAQAELAGYNETIQEEKKLMSKPGVAGTATNLAPAASGLSPSQPEKAVEYQRICTQLNS